MPPATLQPQLVDSHESRLQRVEETQQVLVGRVSEIAANQVHENFTLDKLSTHIETWQKEAKEADGRWQTEEREVSKTILAKLDEHGSRLTPLEADLQARKKAAAEKAQSRKELWSKVAVGLILAVAGFLGKALLGWL